MKPTVSTTKLFTTFALGINWCLFCIRMLVFYRVRGNQDQRNLSIEKGEEMRKKDGFIFLAGIGLNKTIGNFILFLGREI